MSYRFYWLIDGLLAGCSRPGGPERSSWGENTAEAAAQLHNDLAWLCRQGVGAVLSLTETPLPAEALAENHLEALHLPVPDMTAPLPAQFTAALAFIDRQVKEGRPVAVHCLVGQGRTATILAAYLIRAGMSSDEAIVRLRELFPGAIESSSQEEALERFAARRDWMV